MIRRAVSRAAWTLAVLLVGIGAGSSLVSEETEAVMSRDSACQAMAERADTLVKTYADAYAANATENPQPAYWQTKMNEHGWDYVNAREKCWAEEK